MISNDIASALRRSLCFAERGRDAIHSVGGFDFQRDFDSTWTWPDVPFDTGAHASHYPHAARNGVLEIIDQAGQLTATRAPRARQFVNAQLETVLLRRFDAIDGASSSSNRAHIGVCLWTNLERSPDQIHTCVEGLLHEAVHQMVYKMERDSGNFCDLSDIARFRSPWSGNRIPLHSLVHACLVWYALLTLWCQLARTSTDEPEQKLIGERVARVLFGFTFIEDIFASPAFPRQSVEPAIRDLIRDIAQTCSVVRAPETSVTAQELFDAVDNGAWIDVLARRIDSGVSVITT